MLILVVLLTLPFCLTAPMSNTDRATALKFFKRYGYLPENYEFLENKEILLEQAIRNFEKFSKIRRTGEMNTEMMKMMKQPRCGMKDMYSKKTQFRKFVTAPTIWDKTKLTYKITDYSEKIPKTELEKTLQQSFDAWAKYTNLNFTKTDGKADIHIGFYAGTHCDAGSFDGSGGVLAHATFPTHGIIHFDEEEYWDLNLNSNSIHLFQVATHEIGHALGLEHSYSKGAIMGPFYSREVDYRNGLDRDDINGIQYLYGPKTESDCNNKKITSVIFQDNVVTIFKNGKFTTNRASGVVKNVTDVWEGIDEHSKVLATTSKIYFFSGDQFWRFTGRNMDEDYPQKISARFPGIPSNIDVAVHINNHQLYFFKGDQFWVFNTLKIPRVSPEYPKLISREFKGLPSNLEAIVWNEKNNELFAIKDGETYYYSFEFNRVYATGKLFDFFACNM